MVLAEGGVSMKKTTREQCEEVIATRVEWLVTRWQEEKTQEEMCIRDRHNACLRNKNGEIINNNNCYTSNLNHLPLPDREVYDISAYIRRDSETIVRSSRGCPGNCSFCIKTKMSKFRLFTIKRFCDEIEIRCV